MSKHIHKYHLINLGTKREPRKVYACASENCNHHMPNKKLVVGKLSICWKCNKPFKLDSEVVMRHPRTKPKCLDCRKGKTAEERVEDRRLESALEMIMSMKGEI
jgi:hypothetical protein